MAQNICPVCGNEYEDEVRICVPCQIDLRTGERIQTSFSQNKTMREIRAEAEAKIAQETTTRDYVIGLFPGFFQGRVLLLSVVLMVIALGLGGLGMFVLSLGAMMEGMVIAGMGVICYAQVLAMLISGHVSLLQECLADFAAPQWYAFLGFFLTPFFLWVMTLLLYARFLA